MEEVGFEEFAARASHSAASAARGAGGEGWKVSRERGEVQPRLASSAMA